MRDPVDRAARNCPPAVSPAQRTAGRALHIPVLCAELVRQQHKILRHCRKYPRRRMKRALQMHDARRLAFAHTERNNSSAWLPMTGDHLKNASMPVNGALSPADDCSVWYAAAASRQADCRSGAASIRIQALQQFCSDRQSAGTPRRTAPNGCAPSQLNDSASVRSMPETGASADLLSLYYTRIHCGRQAMRLTKNTYFR